MKRREFLDPRHLLKPAAEVLAAVEDLHATVQEDAAAQAALLRFGRHAMATSFEVILPFATPRAHEAAEDALEEIDRLEAQLTVYRDDSEVSRINREAAQAPVAVETNLFELFQHAQRLHAATAGAFDIAVGALIKAWGFFRRQGRFPSDDEHQDVLEKIGMKHVILDAENTTVTFPKPGVEINLGSIGKGYALDRVARRLKHDWGISTGVVHGGQSSILAMGSEAGSRRGWSVGVMDPRFPSRRMALVWLQDRALGTSAATFQHFEHQGRRLGHILDPRTGRPAEGMFSATVLAPTAAEADALATAFFILGEERCRAYCQEHPEIAALLLPHRPNARPVAVNLSVNQFQLLA